jgi:hypothetical protein
MTFVVVEGRQNVRRSSGKIPHIELHYVSVEQLETSESSNDVQLV